MIIFRLTLLAFLSLTWGANAFAQKSTDAKKTRLTYIKDYSRSQNKFIIAELSEETHKALTTPVPYGTAKVWDNSEMQKFLSKNPEELPRAIIFKHQNNPYAPTYPINQGFKNDSEKLQKVRDLLASFTPEQWKGIEASGYNYPARLLTAEQKRLLKGFVPEVNSSDVTYELDFRTWIVVGGASSTGTVRLMGGTATQQ